MKNLFAFLLLVFTLTAYTADADRLSDLQAYPTSAYLTGLGGTQEAAERQLTEKIFRNVENLIERNKTNSAAHGQVQEHYGLVLQSKYSAKIEELTTKAGSDARGMYVIAYVNRGTLKSRYNTKVSTLASQINSLLSKAQNEEHSAELIAAVNTYLSSYHLYEALKEAELIQLGANVSMPSNAFNQLHGAAIGSAKGTLTLSHGEVVEKVKQLQSKPLYNIGSIAKEIAYQFNQQDSRRGSQVTKQALTYDGITVSVNVASANQFYAALGSQLGWSIVPPKLTRGFKRKGAPPVPHSADPSLRFCGTYWPDGDRVTLRTVLRDTSTGDFKAAAVVQFNESHRQDSSTPIKSENHEETIDKVEGHKPPPDESRVEPEVHPSAGLRVEVSTNKGGPGDSITYKEGETMELYLKVNRAAYIRAIYILATGERTLLMDDNYYIDSSKAGQIIPVGEFVCAPPFGNEQLHVYAQEEPFTPFKPGETYEMDGYVFIKDTTSTRGFLPKKRGPGCGATSHNSNFWALKVKRWGNLAPPYFAGYGLEKVRSLLAERILALLFSVILKLSKF